MFAECPIRLQVHEAITKRKFLSTLFASFQSRSELEHSSSRYVSDSSLPLRPQAVHESSEIQAASLYPPPMILSILLISPFHTWGTNAFSEGKGAMTLLHEFAVEKSLLILQN